MQGQKQFWKYLLQFTSKLVSSCLLSKVLKIRICKTVLPVVSNEYETWFLMLMKEDKLQEKR
jgi:hypothetical protein